MKDGWLQLRLALASVAVCRRHPPARTYVGTLRFAGRGKGLPSLLASRPHGQYTPPCQGVRNQEMWLIGCADLHRACGKVWRRHREAFRTLLVRAVHRDGVLHRPVAHRRACTCDSIPLIDEAAVFVTTCLLRSNSREYVSRHGSFSVWRYDLNLRPVLRKPVLNTQIPSHKDSG